MERGIRSSHPYPRLFLFSDLYFENTTSVPRGKWNLKKKTVIIMDWASIHTSDAIIAKLSEWVDGGQPESDR